MQPTATDTKFDKCDLNKEKTKQYICHLSHTSCSNIYLTYCWHKQNVRFNVKQRMYKQKEIKI